MVKRQYIRVRTILFILALASFFESDLLAADLNVPSQYPDIRSAYAAAAQSGDRIILAPGRYSGAENTLKNVTKEIEIKGTPTKYFKSFIDLDHRFQFYTSNTHNLQISISDLTIANGSPTLPVIFTKNKSMYLSNVSLKFSGLCISAINSSLSTQEIELHDVEFFGNKECVNTQNTRNIFNDCKFIYSNDTCAILENSTSIFGKCRFYSNNRSHAVRSTGRKSSNYIYECDFEGHDVGFEAIDGDHYVRRSVFVNNSLCIKGLNLGDVQIEGCDFLQNHFSINIDNASSCLVQGTTFKSNRTAMDAVNMRRLSFSNCFFDSNANSYTYPVDSIVKVKMNTTNSTSKFEMHFCTLGYNWARTVVDVNGQAGGTNYASTIQNNIFWNPWSNEEVKSNSHSSSGHHNNLVRGGGFGTRVMVSDPQFFSTHRARDLTLGRNSPALNAGLPVALISHDLNGTLRDKSTPDLGAFERTTCIRQTFSRSVGYGTVTYHVYGQPGRQVHLFLSPTKGEIQTPFGQFLLDPQKASYVGVLGTTNSEGYFSIEVPHDVVGTNGSGLYMQMLVGDQLTTNTQIMYSR